MLVIAKAYMGEPLVREQVSASETRRYLINPSLKDAVQNVESTAVGFRPATVFVHEDGLYRDLRGAFDSGDESALAALWEKARPT